MGHCPAFLLFLLATTTCMLIIVTQQNPFDLPALLQSSLLTFKNNVLTAEQYFSQLSIDGELVLDCSYDARTTLALPENQTVVIWPSRISRSFTLYRQDYEVLFTQYLRAINVKKVTVLSDDERHNLVGDFPDVYADVIFFPRDNSLEFIVKIVRKLIKPSGHTLFAIFLQKRTTLLLLQALELTKLNKAGFLFILSETSSYYRELCENCTGLLATGVLCIVPAFRANARSEEEALVATFSLIARSELPKDSSPADVLRIIDTSLVVINIVNSRAVIVARSIEEAKVFTGVFPGGVTVLPKGSRLSIPVSINYYKYIEGSDIPVSDVIMRGFDVAFEEKEKSTFLLSNFDLDVQPVDFQALTLNITLVQDRMIKSQSRLGLIHFPLSFSALITMTYAAFKGLNMSIPMSTIFADAALANKTEYPLLLAVSPSSDYFAFVIVRVIGRFEWKRIAVIYGSGADIESVYRSVVKYADDFGVTIINSETSRRVVENYTNGPTTELNATLAEIIQSSVRIIVILVDNIGMVLETMYDLGVRSDYLIISHTIPTMTSIQNIKPNIPKRVAVANGALIINPQMFIGAVGQRVYNKLMEKDGQDLFVYGCFFYDAAMLYFYATEYMVDQGLDYENAAEIIKAMRGTHFIGCSGTVYISPESNMRPEAEFAVKNFKYFEGNQSIEVEDVLYFNPFSSILMKEVSAVMWPDGTYNFWNDTLDLNCPFRDSEVQSLAEGFTINVFVSVGALLLAIITSVFSWRRWRNVQYSILTSQEELSCEDMTQMIAVPLEVVQIIVLGSKSTHLNEKIVNVADLSNFQFSIFIGASGAIFWKMVKLIFGIVGVYVFVCVLVLTNLEKRIEWMPLLPFLLLFAKLLLPAASNLLFIPVVSLLLQVFQCRKAAGNTLSDSFLDRDCNTWCWQGSHLLFAAGSAIALAIFIPVLVLTKSSWQESNKALHLKLQPLSLVFKSVFHALLVVAETILQSEYENVHSGVYLSLLIIHIVYMIKFPLYNYHR